MVNIFVDPSVSNSSPVIRIGEICFSLVGDSQTAIDTTEIDSKFNDCPSCEVCDGVDCVGDPSMILTVFDADYVGATINWCGESWTPAQVIAGETRCVCPTSFQRTKSFSTSPGTATAGNYATWYHTGGLRMSRYVLFSQFFTVPSTFLKAQFVRLTWNVGGAVTDRRGKIQNFFTTGPPTGPAFYTNTSALGVFNPTNAAYDATVNDYKIINEQFGSHTNAGVQYTWARGDNWA